MKNNKLKKVISGSLLLAASFCAGASSYSNSFVFGDSYSDNGNFRAFSGNPAFPERFSNGPVSPEIVAAHLGLSLTPSLHLIPGVPHGNNYATATATAVDADGDELTPDINLPTQVNSFLLYHSGIAPSDALYTVEIGPNDIGNAFSIRAAGMLSETREERLGAIQAAKTTLKAAVESEEAQIRKLIAAGAQSIIVLNAPDIGTLPWVDMVTENTLALATNNRQERRANRLPRVATRLTVKFNKLLARAINRIERDTGVDIIEFDQFSSLASLIDSADDLGYTQIDNPCIYILQVLEGQELIINPECTDFPAAKGFIYWDELHPTGTVHAYTAQGVLEQLLSQ